MLREQLEKIGLADKEAKVFLASLELGSDTAQNIATKAGVNRATTYVIIEKLMKKEDIKSKLNKNISLLEKKYHIKKLGLFGSVARGEQKNQSNIDILVEFSAPIYFFDFMRLENFLSELLDGKVDLVSKKAVKPFLQKYIQKDLIYV